MRFKKKRKNFNRGVEFQKTYISENKKLKKNLQIYISKGNNPYMKERRRKSREISRDLM